jgi:hypothetical protein
LPEARKPYWMGRLSILDLLIKIDFFVKKRKNIFSIWKAADLN